MSHHKIEFDCQCESCKGTGLYKGLCERDMFAVVCHSCEGTGKVHRTIEYDDFTKRKIRKDVGQVLETNAGIVAGTGNGYTIDSFGGMRYKEWLEDKPFPPKSEMRQFVCPAWWYQSADYELKPDWDWCDAWGRSFSACKRFAIKELCWARFDKEHNTPES